MSMTLNVPDKTKKAPPGARVIRVPLEQLRLDEWGMLLLPDGREFHVADQVLRRLAIYANIPVSFFLFLDVVCQSFLFNHLIARRRQRRRHLTEVVLFVSEADEVVWLEVLSEPLIPAPRRSQ